MKRYEPKDIRSIAIVGHSGCGKTSLGEAFFYITGVNTRLGAVDDQTSMLDFEPEEHKRGGSISSAFGAVEWNGTKVNFVDTPGDGNFIYDGRTAMLGADSAICVVSAVDGMEVNTEKAWRFAIDLSMPVGVFINKMDRERANPAKALEDIQEVMGVRAIPLQVPVGTEADFRGVVDLISKEMVTFAADDSGKVETGPIPDEVADEVEEATEAMIEAAAEADEELLEKYFDVGELTAEEVRQGLVVGIKTGSFVPVMFGAAGKNHGVGSLLDALSLFPDPLSGTPRQVRMGDSEDVEELTPDPERPFAGLVVKSVNDPFSGKLTIFRVVAGTIDADTSVINTTKDGKERFGQINVVQGKKVVPVGHAMLGDIVAVAKLKDTSTFDTLCADKHPLHVVNEPLPQPMMSYIVRAKSKGDEDKIKAGLLKLMEEDPTLAVSQHELTSEIVMSGMGQTHVDTTIAKLGRKYGVEVELDLPPVPYKETIKGNTRIQGRHKKQTGGRGQFGDTWLRIAPQPRGEGFLFKSEIVGGAIPRQYIPAVEKGIVESMVRGPLAGYPVVDVLVVLDDGSFHKVDSSEMAFKTAGSKGFKKGFLECSPTLIEPILDLEIVVPNENTGDIMGDVNSRRGRVITMEPRGRNSVIIAQMPHSEVLEYAKALQSITGGKGSYTMAFSHNEEVPAHLTQKIIDSSPFKQKEDDD